MSVQIMACRSCLARAGLFAMILALVPLPVAAADEAAHGKSTTNIKVSMERMVARDIASAPDTSSLARPARQGQAAGKSAGFFKSKPGIIALVVMAAGTGYALYSASHDRLHSPGKQ